MALIDFQHARGRFFSKCLYCYGTLVVIDEPSNQEELWRERFLLCGGIKKKHAIALDWKG